VALRLLRLLLVIALAVAIGYLGYLGYEGSRVLVYPPRSVWCFTPMQFDGWAYEPINYDGTDDAALAERQPDPYACTEHGAPAGDEVVTRDGASIAGWYIPAGSGAGPEAPTIVLTHGHGDSKSGMLKYARLLHDEYNLVLFDLRNHGKSSGDVTTMGVREQRDVRAVLNWLERAKAPSQVALFGNSLGGATAAQVADDDPRVVALALDSTHALIENTIQSRLRNAGHPIALPGFWSVWLGSFVRTGENIASADAVDAVDDLGRRPLLIIQGGADAEQGPENADALLAAATDAGVTVTLHVCPEATHGRVVDTCPDEYAVWVRDFFASAFATAAAGSEPAP
jgi:pimeloyl-ACP methyl ester carboxylesterase